jgi:hypothetical protein
MNTNEVQEELSIRIANIEEEETRLQEWLECLQRVGAIAAEWKVELPAIQPKPTVQSELAQVEISLLDPVEESIRNAEEQTHPEAEGQSACLDRASFEMNLQQLRQSAEQEKEKQNLQDKEFDQLREQLCASRPRSSISGRLGTLMSFLMKV